MCNTCIFILFKNCICLDFGSLWQIIARTTNQREAGCTFNSFFLLYYLLQTSSDVLCKNWTGTMVFAMLKSTQNNKYSIICISVHMALYNSPKASHVWYLQDFCINVQISETLSFIGCVYIRTHWSQTSVEDRWG